jgi:adenosylhomocysteine nucleosidase
MKEIWVGILAALPIEARSLTPKKLSIGQTIALKNNLLLHIAGMGAEQARVGAYHLLSRGVNALVSWGTAGGLAPGLRAGQLVLPNQVMDEQRHVFNVDAEWRTQLKRQLENQLLITDGILLQTQHILTSVSAKQYFFEQYQAVAVDMESVAIATAAHSAKAPFMAIRSIVDTADFALPEWLLQSLTLSGEMRPRALMGKLCRDPRRLQPLIRLARDFSLAQATLKEVQLKAEWDTLEIQLI